MTARSAVPASENPPHDKPEARDACVRLDSGLRAMDRQAWAARLDPPSRAAARLDREPSAARTETPAAAAEGPDRELRLRRDGGRPHRFRGSLIVEKAVESRLGSGALVRQSLAIWRGADGGAVLQIVLETPEVPALRPLHRLTASPSAEALRAAVAAHDPIDGFADLPFQTADALALARAEADRLRDDFLNLAGTVLRAFPRKTDEDASR